MKRGFCPLSVHSALPMTPSPFPTVLGRPQEITEHTGRLTALAAGKTGFLKGRRDFLFQTLVAGQSEDIGNLVNLAPVYQIVAGKAGIGPQCDAYLRPGLADLRHDPLDHFDRSLADIDVGAPQFGRQQVPTAEDVERQVAIALVIAMEEPPLLPAVQRIIRGIQIKDDLTGRFVMGFQEQIHQQPFNGTAVMADLVIARRPVDRCVLQPVQRRLAGKGSTVRPLRRQAFRQQGQHRVMTKRIVIVDVLIAQSDRRNTLSDQGPYTVNRAIAIAPVDKASRHPFEQPDGFVGFAQQQCPGVAGDRSAIKTGNNFAPVKAFKFELFGDTVCLHRTPSLNLITLCCKRIFSDSWGRCTPRFERSGLALQNGRTTATCIEMRSNKNMQRLLCAGIEGF